MNYHKNLKSQVLRCLNEYHETRNCDIELTTRIWKVFYASFVKVNDRGIELINLEDLKELPREDNVKRVRAKIQNHKEKPRYLPTDPLVRQKRFISEEQLRKSLGYSPELREI